MADTSRRITQGWKMQLTVLLAHITNLFPPSVSFILSDSQTCVWAKRRSLKITKWSHPSKFHFPACRLWEHSTFLKSCVTGSSLHWFFFKPVAPCSIKRLRTVWNVSYSGKIGSRTSSGTESVRRWPDGTSTQLHMKFKPSCWHWVTVC